MESVSCKENATTLLVISFFHFRNYWSFTPILQLSEKYFFIFGCQWPEASLLAHLQLRMKHTMSCRCRHLISGRNMLTLVCLISIQQQKAVLPTNLFNLQAKQPLLAVTVQKTWKKALACLNTTSALQSFLKWVNLNETSIENFIIWKCL